MDANPEAVTAFAHTKALPCSKWLERLEGGRKCLLESVVEAVNLQHHLQNYPKEACVLPSSHLSADSLCWVDRGQAPHVPVSLPVWGQLPAQQPPGLLTAAGLLAVSKLQPSGLLDPADQW